MDALLKLDGELKPMLNDSFHTKRDQMRNLYQKERFLTLRKAILLSLNAKNSRLVESFVYNGVVREESPKQSKTMYIKLKTFGTVI